MKSLKYLITGAAILCIAFFAIASNAVQIYEQIRENEFIKKLKSNLEQYNDKFPQDRVYLQFDKPFYKPGETIWFSAYLRNASDMKPSEKSQILHVDLINPRGSTQKSIKLISKKGKSQGDFLIDESAAGGLYKVRAWTNWQKNEGDSIFFEKELQVQKVVLPRLKMKLDFERKAFGAGDRVIAKLEVRTNENKELSQHAFEYTASIDGKEIHRGTDITAKNGEMYISFELPNKIKSEDALLNVMLDFEGQTESISRAIPIILHHINLDFFPEGGDLVQGLPSTVAFKATNSKGKAADVSGSIYDQNGIEVSTFTSFHNGMGAFGFTPLDGNIYYAMLSTPGNISTKYYLPEALGRGFVLNTEVLNDNEMEIKVHSTETDKMSLVAQVRGDIYYASELAVEEGINKFRISTQDFPMGVAQLTLFDSKEVARCERLVFLNKHKQLNIEIETDKEKYQPREKVKMIVRVSDERGMPMPAQLSLAMADDQLLTFADDKSGNILSQMLLEQDIMQKVEEASFYFDKNEEKADAALDYLLMTAGWRRFVWEDIIELNPPSISFQPERAVIHGMVLDAGSRLPVNGAQISTTDGKKLISSNREGKFIIKDFDLSHDNLLAVNADGYQIQQLTVNEYGMQNIFLYDKNKYRIQADDKRVRNVPMEELQMAMAAVNDKSERREKSENAIPEGMAELINPEEDMLDDNAEMNVKEDDEDLAAADIVAFEPDVFVVNDERAGAPLDQLIPEQQKQYYRAREFPRPVYENSKPAKYRNDYRSTIYWNGDIEVDRSGKAEIEFFTSDAITSFAGTVEGIASDGSIGRAEIKIYNQQPVNLTCKVPVEVVTGDVLSVPVFIKNNKSQNVQARLKIVDPHEFRRLQSIPESLTLAAGESQVIYLKYEVRGKSRIASLMVSLDSEGFSDSFQQEIEVKSKGFPVQVSFSGKQKSAKHKVHLQDMVQGSLKVDFTAYPSVVSDLLKGIEGILREPSGCFEQTSMSSYPNALVLDYMKTTGVDDPKLLASAGDLLDRGYDRLTTFETTAKGYDWFGRAPANEALTAYGLMQFNDMKALSSKVDQGMIDRTASWLMSRKNNEGGFQKNNSAADSYGRASQEITDAYIVYALTEAGYGEKIQTEYKTQMESSAKSNDPYLIGLMANAALTMNDPTQQDVYDRLMELQKENGSWCGTDHSITRSTGVSLEIETTSLAIMAMLKKKNPNREKLTKAVEHLILMRSGSGAFGNTQGTIMALKALTAYAKFAKQTDESGTIEIWVDGLKVHERHYEAGSNEAIEIKGLEVHFEEGVRNVKVQFRDVKNPLPYSLNFNWNTSLPETQNECNIDLKVKLDGKSVRVGETARLDVNIKNKTGEGLASPIAIIGIPAGFTFQPWQLKKMQDEQRFDFYELKGNNLILYYRQMTPEEIFSLNFDLKAEISGSFEAPASCAYEYYTNEYKDWIGMQRIHIGK